MLTGSSRLGSVCVRLIDSLGAPLELGLLWSPWRRRLLVAVSWWPLHLPSQLKEPCWPEAALSLLPDSRLAGRLVVRHLKLEILRWLSSEEAKFEFYHVLRKWHALQAETGKGGRGASPPARLELISSSEWELGRVEAR